MQPALALVSKIQVLGCTWEVAEIAVGEGNHGGLPGRAAAWTDRIRFKLKILESWDGKHSPPLVSSCSEFSHP